MNTKKILPYLLFVFSFLLTGYVDGAESKKETVKLSIYIQTTDVILLEYDGKPAKQITYANLLALEQVVKMDNKKEYSVNIRFSIFYNEKTTGFHTLCELLIQNFAKNKCPVETITISTNGLSPILYYPKVEEDDN